MIYASVLNGWKVVQFLNLKSPFAALCLICEKRRPFCSVTSEKTSCLDFIWLQIDLSEKHSEILSIVFTNFNLLCSFIIAEY